MFLCVHHRRIHQEHATICLRNMNLLLLHPQDCFGVHVHEPCAFVCAAITGESAGRRSKSHASGSPDKLFTKLQFYTRLLRVFALGGSTSCSCRRTCYRLHFRFHVPISCRSKACPAAEPHNSIRAMIRRIEEVCSIQARSLLAWSGHCLWCWFCGRASTSQLCSAACCA